ncbi:MAG: glycosyltransferase family 2 protein [Sulfuritalea sp.]|jgi:glycosyltransferase involved in cell wall biosynthesis|nr:glycosyltransferase family 2 protein [Sulfuritalea sp.]MBP7423835.1 glycosyltransferase family 2 protein [Sulfuritalea sp.]
MKPEPRQRLSAVLITRDAAGQLAECLESLAFCDEIVVVDAGSTDGTQALAAKHGARVIESEWRGFGPQKQFAVAQAANDWVLCIDADERVSETLRQSILALTRPRSGVPGTQSEPAPALCVPAGTLSAYRFARCNRFMGRYLRHGEGYPDWSLRFFDRRVAGWSDDAVHERVIAQGEVDTLAGDLLHDSAESLENYLAKQNRYSTLAAEAALARGKRANVIHLLMSPLMRFIKFYFLRLGLLDGVPGLVHILIGCTASFAKYAKMLAFQRSRP